MNEDEKEGTAGDDVLVAELAGSRKRLKERYPEEDLTDDGRAEDVYNRYMNEVEGEIGKYRGAEGQLTELCRVYPEFAELLHNMVANKMPLRVAIAKLFAQEDLIPQEGDDDYESYGKVYSERLEGVKKRDAQGKELDANEAASMAEIDRFCTEKGLSDEQKDGLLDVINGHFTELLFKRISTEMLEGFLKQMSFDSAVAEAEQLGEIRGKNANIEAVRVKDRAKTVGDGMPGAVSGGGDGMEPRPQGLRNFLEKGGSRTNYSELLKSKR